MNTHHSTSTLFQDRNLDEAIRPSKPARFSTEIEGEGMELFLRGLLVACLLAAMTICGASLESVAKTHNDVPVNSAACVATPAPAPLVASR